jgi:hypothetical protein
LTKGYKTGGRQKGTKNKPRPVFVEPSAMEKIGQALTVLAPTMEVRTPKAVMLDAMQFFDSMAWQYHAEKQFEKAAKFMATAVQIADKVAPYIHARLLAVESRGDMTRDQPLFVLRAPSVVEDSVKWQAMVSEQSEVRDKAEAIREAVLERWPVVHQPQVENNAPRASGGDLAAMPHPAMPNGLAETEVPAAMPTPLRADQETGRITVMPPGPRVVQPLGSEEWLASIKKVGSLKIVSS